MVMCHIVIINHVENVCISDKHIWIVNCVTLHGCFQETQVQCANLSHHNSNWQIATRLNNIAELEVVYLTTDV